VLKDHSLLFLGDVVPYKPVRFRNKTKTVINLECPIFKTGLPQKGKINLSVSDNYLGIIFKNNLFSVSLANNHMLDFGNEGFESTLLEIEKLNVTSFGYTVKGAETNNPLITKIDGITLALFSVVCESTSPLMSIDEKIQLGNLDMNWLIDATQAVRNKVHRIVVYIHWGTEESSYPELREIRDARKLIDCGVDIVIGSHAHSPQPVERYKSGIIAYNLGNFIMPELKNIPTYFNDKGIAQSTYNKHTMLWNRISWGLLIDMATLEFKLHRFIFINNRIFRLFFTPLDKYIRLRTVNSEEEYNNVITRHLKKRALYRRIVTYLLHPHVPEKMKRIL